MAGRHPAVFYDGKTAIAHSVGIQFGAAEIIFSDSTGVEHRWPYAEVLSEKLATEARLTIKTEPDATLVLSNATYEALTGYAPDLTAEKQRRRSFAKLIVGLTSVAAVTAIFVFGVVPSLATTLAKRTPIETEQQIGENLASQIQLIFRACDNDEAHAILNPIVQELAEAGGIEHDVELTLVRTPLPNAFALPGGQMMATRGFLDAVGEDQEAFWAVIAHELAHVKNRDGMVAVYRNLGLSTLLELVTGGSGFAQQAILVGGQLTALSYTRGQEQAADDTAYDILDANSLDPAALGRALTALTNSIKQTREDDTKASPLGFEIPEWLESHPDTEQRIERAEARSSPGSAALPLSAEMWDKVRFACETDNQDED